MHEISSSDPNESSPPLFIALPDESPDTGVSAEGLYTNSEITAPNTSREVLEPADKGEQVAADLRALGYYIDTMMEGAPDAIEWHYLPEEGQQDIVIGRMGITVLTVEAEHQLSIVRWLGYEASEPSALAYRIHDVPNRLMVGWAAGADCIEQLQYRRPSRNYSHVHTLKHDAVSDASDQLAAYRQLLSQGSPMQDDALEASLPGSIHARPPLSDRLRDAYAAMMALSPELFE